MTPIAKTSDSIENSISWRVSGAMYNGDPALTLLRLLLSKWTANPKSATIGYPLLKNIFSGFKSLWIIFWLYKWAKPLMIPSAMIRVYF